MQKWFKHIWFKYLESQDLFKDGIGYLFLDKGHLMQQNKLFQKILIIINL